MRLTIRSKLILLVLAVLLPLLVVAASKFWRDLDEGRRSAQQEQVDTARLVARQLDEVIAGQVENLVAVAAVHSFERVQDSALATLAVRVRDRHPFVLRFYTTDPAGHVLASSDGRAAAPATVSLNRETIESALQSGAVRVGPPAVEQSPEVGQSTDRSVVPIVVPVHDGLGAPVGLVAAELDLQKLSHYLNLLPLGREQILAIVSTSGAILARTGDPAKFLRRDLGTIPEVNALLRRGIGIAEWRSPEGIPLLAGAASMSGAPWLVVSGVPSGAAYGPAAARFKRDLIGLATAMVLALLGAWLIGNRMHSSVQALMRGTRELAADEGPPITVPTKDELAELAEQFNRAIGDRRRTAAALEVRQRRLRALADINVALSQQLDLEPLLQQITLTLSSLTGARTVVFWMADPARGRLTRRAWAADVAVDSVDLPAELTFDQDVTGWIAREGRALFIEDVTQDPRVMAMDWAIRHDLYAFAGVPVVASGELLGVLTLNLRREDLLGEDDEALLLSFASQAAVAVRNARLFAETEEKRQAAETLAGLSRSLAEALDTEVISQQISDSLSALLHTGTAGFFRVDPATGEVRAVALTGSFGTLKPGDLWFPAGMGAAGLAVRERRLITTPDFLTDPRITFSDETRARMAVLPYRSVLTLPLMVKNEVVGVLSVGDRAGRIFSEADQRLARAFGDHAALTLAKARLYDEATRRRREAEALARLARALTESLDVTAVAERTVEHVNAVFSARSAVIRLRRRDGSLVALASSGMAREQLPPGHVLPPGVGISARAVAEGRAVWSPDINAMPGVVVTEDLRRRNDGSQIAAALAVPLRTTSEIIGNLVVGDMTGREFTPAEAALLQTFADQAALALDNARLYSEATRRQHEAEELARMARALTGSLEVHEIGRRIVDSVRPLLHVQSAGFRLLQPDGSLAMLAHGQIDSVHAPYGHVMPAGYGVTGRVVADGHVYVTADITSDPTLRLTDEMRRRVEQTGNGAFAAVPLRVQGRPIGALSVADTTGRVFTEVEVALLQTFADQAALALDHSRLYEQTRERLRHVESIREVIEQILVPFSLEERLNLIARKAAELFDADLALVGLRPESQDHLVIRAGYQLHEGELGQRLELGEGALGLAAERRDGVLVNDYATWAGRIQRPFTPRREPLRATIAYPLLVRGEAIGALSVAYIAKERQFKSEDLDRLATLVAPAALAIEHSRLYDQLASRLRELQDTQAQLVQAGKLSAVGQLVSGVAHELNNPLSVVIGYGQLLRGKPLPADLKGPIEMIVSQGERMAKIVQSLLLFSRQRKPERAPVLVAAVIEQTVALRATRLRLSGIKVEFDQEPDLPPAEGDIHQIQQVFLNLLLNAEHAILGSGVGDTIRVRAASRVADGKRWVEVEFGDNGPGIPGEVLPRIFEPFFTTKKVGEGTGLGLSVSYGIVQQHGGRLTVESEPGRTVFLIELPAAVGAEPVPSAGPAHQPGVYGFGRRALVVDDEPGMVDLVTTLLKEAGWQVEVAATGRSALERVRAIRYDVIVSDIRMPDGSGEAFYRAAVQEQAALARRFVFITGDTANPSAWQFLEEVQAPILEKPFAAADLFRAIERLTILTSRAAFE
jgi:GAF domain-containing protein/ActR/RegA family two-component response regulator